MGQKHVWEKIVLNFYFSWTVNSNKYVVLMTLSSTLLRTKKKTVKKSEIWVKFFTIGCMFCHLGDGMTCKLTHMSASTIASKYSLQVLFQSFSSSIELGNWTVPVQFWPLALLAKLL